MRQRQRIDAIDKTLLDLVAIDYEALMLYGYYGCHLDAAIKEVKASYNEALSEHEKRIWSKKLLELLKEKRIK